LILLIIILINDIYTSEFVIDSTTVQPIHEKIGGEILKIQNDLKTDEEQLKIDRQKFEEEKKQKEKYFKNIDVIRLNVGGEIIMTTRQTLTRIPKSILSMIFNGRWEHKLKIDQNGNIFFDFNPIIFRHLLDQLQLFDSKNFINFFPPSNPSLFIPFKKMIHKLGLNKFLSSEKKIIIFNVDGQIITNQRRTFNQISNSTFNTIIRPSKTSKFDNKSDVFVDYNPKLFRHLINQLREKSFKNISYLEVSSKEEKISFQRMLNDFSIFRK
jgi:hypothetical protein